MRKLSRVQIGSHFSEAARLLWMAAEAAGSQEALAKDLGITGGHLTKILYGDHKVGRELAERLRAAHGIPLAAWDEAPTVPFVLPALQSAVPAAPEA